MEKNAASLPSDLKDSNRRLVLEAFCRRAENSAVMIAEETGLSRQTVKNASTTTLELAHWKAAARVPVPLSAESGRKCTAFSQISGLSAFKCTTGM